DAPQQPTQASPILGGQRRSLTGGVGFWFSLGHSSVVFGLSLLLAIGVGALAGPVQDENSTLQTTLGLVGSLVAGTFLIVIGLTNLSALFGIIHVFRHMRAGSFDEEKLEHHLHQRGFMARLFRRATHRVTMARHLYPVGLLMGLGFDTATQVALLILAGGVATSTLPWYAVLVLPVLFAAGMTLFDTADGIFMARAYKWALISPLRRVYYNLTITTLSVVVALVIGGVVLLQLLAEQLQLDALAWVTRLDLQYVGYLLVAMFVVVWAISFAVWKLGRVEARLARGA
ncbi:HoxN/HupN/NixA family nickel/cobalt transporter, partial [Nocardioides hungaricus]